MAIKYYNVPPYYDDFDQTKNYLRVLFRPGYAVQARELTQLQTAIQAQIDRFGSHVFKEGSQVLGGEVTIDTKYAYIKVESSVTVSSVTYNADVQAPLAVGRILTGAVTGITAEVLEVTASTDSHPTTLFVKYLTADTVLNKYLEFGASEQLSFSPSGGGTRYFKVGAASTIPIGYGTRLSLTEGVFFTKGCFAYTPATSIIMSKYNNGPSGRLVYTVSESIVTSAEDATLVDNAQGTPNAAAPGAHRYAISLDLSIQPYTLVDRTDTNIIQVAVIKNGKIIAQAHSEYAQLNDTLAQRTYEESGNYTVRPFQINIREYYNDGENNGLYTAQQINDAKADIANNTQAATYGAARLAVGLEPSVAYVNGYRIELVDTQYVEVEKARDEGYINAASTVAALGGYVNVVLTGNCGLPDITNFSRLRLQAAPTSGTLGATLTAGTNTVTLTSGNTSSLALGQGLIKTNSGSGAFSEFAYITNIIDSTHFTVSINHASSGSLTFTNGVIGSARARSLEYSGSSNIYRLYLFDVVMTGGVFSDTTYIYQTGTPAFSVAVSGTAAISDVGNNTLVYKLPVDAIQTLRTSDGLIDTLYYVKRKYDNKGVTSSTVSITANADEIFESNSVNDWKIVDYSTGAVVAISGTPVIGSGGTQITFTLTSFASGNVSIIGPSRRNLREKIKRYITNQATVIASPNLVAGSYDSLAVTDLFKLKAVVMSANSGTVPAYTIDGSGNVVASTDNTIITDRYLVDNGQRDNFYDVARIQLQAGAIAPTGQIAIVFDYFSHQPGDYFTVDSYTGIAYEDIPAFQSSRGLIQLRDAIDFRPTKDTTGTNFTGTGASTVNMVKPGSIITCDIQYYLPRIDKVYVDKLGNFGVVKGVSKVNPVPPDDPKDAMVLYVLKLGAYTFGPEHVVPVMLDNRRYTMRDIGRLEKRISNIEYYTALSLLERDTAGLQIYDGANARYKNGFIVDSFYGHGIGAATNPDYKCSIDKTEGTLRPAFYQDNVKLLVDMTKSSNVRKTGDLLTLDYVQTSAIEQPYASAVESLNPFGFRSVRGQIFLSPSTDEWRETLRRPDVIVDSGNTYTTYQVKNDNDAGQTVWNDWQTTWSGQTTENEVKTSSDPVWDADKFGYTTTNTISSNVVTTNQQTRTGIRTSYVPSTQTTSTGDRTVEMNVVPYIRSRKIYFKAIGLRPNARVYAFFDGVSVANYVREEDNFLDYTTSDDSTNYLDNTSHPDVSSPLIANESGIIVGSFVIPNTPNLKFKSGQRIFRLTSSATNSTNTVFTSAEAVYSSQGVQNVVQNTIITTRTVNVVRTQVTDNRTVVSSNPATTTTTDFKPTLWPKSDYLPGGALNPIVQRPVVNTTTIPDSNNTASYNPGGTFNPINFTVPEPEGGFPTVTAAQPVTTTTPAAEKSNEWTSTASQPQTIEVKEWQNTTALANDTPTVTTIAQAENPVVSTIPAATTQTASETVYAKYENLDATIQWVSNNSSE